MRRVATAALTLTLAATAFGGCGSSSRQLTPAALRLQREDLVAVAAALREVRPETEREVAATKAAWPLIANGLPGDVSSISSAPRAADAAEGASRLSLPALFGEQQAATLTGPAAELAGLFRSYALLSSRGWRLLDAAVDQVQSGSPASARFARENAALYIESIYDGHFTLAQVGKKLTVGYQKLGGSRRFGASLRQTDVDQLARTYSEASVRLHPHVGVRLGS